MLLMMFCILNVAPIITTLVQGVRCLHRAKTGR